MYTCSYHAERKVAFHAALMCHRLTLRRRLNEMEIWVQTPVAQTVSPQPSETAYAYKRHSHAPNPIHGSMFACFHGLGCPPTSWSSQPPHHPKLYKLCSIHLEQYTAHTYALYVLIWWGDGYPCIAIHKSGHASLWTPPRPWFCNDSGPRAPMEASRVSLEPDWSPKSIQMWNKQRRKPA